MNSAVWPAHASSKDVLARSINMMVWMIFAVGMLQYLSTISGGLQSGEVSEWSLSDDALSGAGPIRFIKDAYLVVVSLIWPVLLLKVRVPERIKQMVRGYFFWMVLVLALGVMPYIYSDTPGFIAIGGIRWLMTLHVAFGAFVLCASNAPKMPNRSPYLPLIAFGALIGINLLVALTQVAKLDYGTFGTIRAHGLFANAGVLSALGVGLAAVGTAHPGASRKHIILFLTCCWLVTASAGSRHGMIVIALMLLYTVFLATYLRQDKRNRLGVLVIIGLVAPVLAVIGYQALVDFAGRGDMISQQFGEGGRATNFVASFEDVVNSDWLQILFGGGIGVGTNSAYTLAYENGITPESIPFNYLVDNGFITLLFQIGFLGSLFFWGGFAIFVVRFSRMLQDRQAPYIFWLFVAVFVMITFAGSFFEQNYLMAGFGVALGYLLRRRTS